MDAAELQDLLAELMDHISDATGHWFCEDPACILCSETCGRDPFTFLSGLGEAIGQMATDPPADAMDAVDGATGLLQRFGQTPTWSYVPGQWGYPRLSMRPVPFVLDPATARRTFIFLKALAVNLALGKGHPRIET